MKNKKYNSVQVYTEYNENSLNSKVREFESDKTFNDVLNDVRSYEVDLVSKDEDWKDYLKDNEEFFDVCLVKENVGVVGYGEDSIILVVSEDSEWFGKLDQDVISEEDYEKFVTYIEDLMYEL